MCALALGLFFLLGAVGGALAERIQVLCDTSGSMKASDQALLRYPGLRFLLSVLALAQRHQVGVRVFTDETREILAPRLLTTDNINKVLEGLRWPADDGGTVLSFDIAEVLADQATRRDVIVLSDAEFESPEVAILMKQAEKLRAAGIRFSAIGLSAAPVNTLAEMAKATGGAYFNLDSRGPRTPAEWELVILRLVFHLYPPDLYVISSTRGIPVNRFARRGIFIAPSHCNVTAPDGRVVCQDGTLTDFPRGQIIPNDKCTILAVRQNGQDLEGFWQFADGAGQRVDAAFVGDSAVEITMRCAPPNGPASDDVVEIPFDVNVDPAALQEMTAEARTRFHLDVSAFGQSGVCSRVVILPGKLLFIRRRALTGASCWRRRWDSSASSAQGLSPGSDGDCSRVSCLRNRAWLI
jgi:hypothetical protein